MKNIINISLMTIAILVFAVSIGSAQIAEKDQFVIRVGAEGTVQVGDSSDDSEVGPSFNVSIGYGLGYGATVYLETGLGWSNYSADEDLSLAQFPILFGVNYNFAELLNTKDVQPYFGVAAGLYNNVLRRDGESVYINNEEQCTSNFGMEAIAGINFKIPDSNFGVDLRAKYNYVFSNTDGIGLETYDRSAINFGLGISYGFSL
ncbi:MAG: outer membrane beta-barrel protein [Bacteroidota bacterium]|nr:outer membrane beta-barrel protein [Bacteroidota bacterium]